MNCNEHLEASFLLFTCSLFTFSRWSSHRGKNQIDSQIPNLRNTEIEQPLLVNADVNK